MACRTSSEETARRRRDRRLLSSLSRAATTGRFPAQGQSTITPICRLSTQRSFVSTEGREIMVLIMSVSRGERGQRNLAWLFEGPSGASKREVWNWWQQRRLRYNRDVFLVGLATWILVLVAGSAAVQPGEDFEEPLMMIFGPLLYALFANLAYTAGPVLDTVYFHAAPRRGLFKAGYISSLVLTALPGVWAVVA